MRQHSKWWSAALLGAVACVTLWPGAAAAQVSGRLTVTDAGGRPAQDLGDAVIWIEGRGPRPAAARVDMSLDARQFRPRVVVVPAGSTVNFPNLDPFNHNVFSLSTPNDFDLGLYGRSEVQSKRFARAGLVRVFCNIHPRMTGFVVVRDNGWYAQPGADGSFTIDGVPAGTYTLKVWHERAPELTRQVTVPAGGLAGLEIAMDASQYRFVQHANKSGQAYGSTRERY
jgi:plastocyanin